MSQMHFLRALVLTAGLAVAADAEAITVRRVSVVELTRDSDDVVVATVRRSVSRWIDGFIVTDHDVEVEVVLKGRLIPRATVVVRVAGGTVGRIGQHIPGAPSLETGRAYVLFLSGGLADARYLAHMTAAVLPLGFDAAGRATVSIPDGMSLSTPVLESSRTNTAQPQSPLDELARSVRAGTP